MQPTGQTRRIKRMDHVAEIDSPARFVCLQMTHHMPTRNFVSEFEYLSFGFLDSILAKVCDTQLEARFHGFDWMSFAYRNQSYLISGTI